MNLKFSWFILILVIFVPFEVIILKYLPVSDLLYSYLRFAVEIFIYLLGGMLLLRLVLLRKIPKGTSIDKPLLVFIGYTILITIINHAPLFQAFMGLRVLLRYIPLFYVLAFINIDTATSKRILQFILSIAVIQCGIAIYQHYAGISPFWYPRASDLEIGGKQVSYRLLATGFGSGREMGAGIGTFGDSVFLALFLFISFVIAFSTLQRSIKIAQSQKLFYSIFLVLITIALFFTYSRGSVLLAFLSVPVIMLIAGARKKLAAYMLIGLVFLSPLILFGVFDTSSNEPYINPKIKYTDPLANITAVFSSSYLDNTLQYSRGAVLTEIGGNLIREFKIIGYSPAQEFALEKAATNLFGSNMPINNLPVINDVYWVAFIIYYGIAGIALYFLILYRIFKASLFVSKHTVDPYFKIFGIAMAALVILVIPYSFILRTFVFRSFGFYFWLLAGLVFSEWRRLRKEQLYTLNA